MTQVILNLDDIFVVKKDNPVIKAGRYIVTGIKTHVFNNCYHEKHESIYYDLINLQSACRLENIHESSLRYDHK